MLDHGALYYGLPCVFLLFFVVLISLRDLDVVEALLIRDLSFSVCDCEYVYRDGLSQPFFLVLGLHVFHLSMHLFLPSPVLPER